MLPVLNSFRASEVRNSLYRETEDQAVQRKVLSSAGNMYGKYDANGKLIGIVFFVGNLNS